MPVYAHETKDSIAGFNGAVSGPRGQRSNRVRYGEIKGVPRVADLISIRALEQTHTVSLPIDTIQQQVSTTPWNIVPDPPAGDDATEQHEEAADIAEEFFAGGFNSNAQRFNEWVKQILNGILTVNAGVNELVPAEDGYLAEMYARDGATMSKAPDKHGRLPDPPDPAYWQFSLSGAIKAVNRDRVLRDLADEIGPLGYGRRAHEPIPFSKDEIVWMAEDGKEWHEYGFGRVQKVKNLVEIILNQDLSNKKYFPANEVPEGIVNVVEANQDQVDEIREWWDSEIKGERHKVGILGGNGSDIEWMPFRASPEELEFIESQEWYNKLVWMVFGLNQNEVGDLAEITRPGGSEQYSAKIWHRTTKPLLELIGTAINNQILRSLRVYDRIDGEIEFIWNFDNPDVERMERQQQKEDLQHGLAVPNEIRRDRGKDPLPWGDMPAELRKATFRQFPRWSLEQFTEFDEEDLPDPQPAAPGLGLSATAGGSSLASSTDTLGDLDDLPKNDSLRSDRWQGEFPPLAGHIEELSDDVAVPIEELGDDLEELVEEQFPEEGEEERYYGAEGSVNKRTLADVNEIVGEIALADRLRDTVIGANAEAMGDSAEWHGDNVEEELRERLDDDEDLEIDLRFDVEDTFAREVMEQRAAQNMSTVNESVKSEVKRTLLGVAEDNGNVSDATDALREKIDELSDSHARLVARTETLSSSRMGSQALAETNDVIEGKEWVATSDSRTRSWHSAMDGTVIPKEEEFVVPSVNTNSDEYQPPDYPRSTLEVGGDQPFNCRCGQRPVLDEDMPEEMSAAELNEYEGVLVYESTDRRREIAEEFRQRGETLGDTVERIIDEAGSVNAATEELGLSKPTVYQWRGDNLAI